MTRPFIKRIGWVVTSGETPVFGGWEFDADWEPLGYDPAGYTTYYGYTMEELAEIAARHKEWFGGPPAKAPDLEDTQ
jgi:hypothetical protein